MMLVVLVAVLWVLGGLVSWMYTDQVSDDLDGPDLPLVLSLLIFAFWPVIVPAWFATCLMTHAVDDDVFNHSEDD